MNQIAPNTSTGTTFTLALVRGVICSVKHGLNMLRNRRQVATLWSLDDRALKDIGLMRSDVSAALMEPLHRDPSLRLIDLAGRGNRQTAAPATTAMPIASPGPVQSMGRLRCVDAPLIGSATA